MEYPSSIHEKFLSSKYDDILEALDFIEKNFELLEDNKRERAWDDILRLEYFRSMDLIGRALRILGDISHLLPDKNKVLSNLCTLADNDLDEIREGAASALGKTFLFLPDKYHAWQYLLGLSQDDRGIVRYTAATNLGSVFYLMPDKNKAWDDLHDMMCYDGDDLYIFSEEDIRWARNSAARALEYAFSSVPDKNKAWEDLHRLSYDQEYEVREIAASTIGIYFSSIPNKNDAWSDLHHLSQDENFVRMEAAFAIGEAFPFIQNKNDAWSDLRRLSQDEDLVRLQAAYAIGKAFRFIQNKNDAWGILANLSHDKDKSVSSSAYYSLGKASIFYASEAKNEQEMQIKLKEAIGFIENSLTVQDNSHSRFCLPFYRSFYTLTFNDEADARLEVKKYLAEAKKAIGGSKNKEMLFTTMENLSLALEEVHKLRGKDLEYIQNHLNAHREYLDKTVELLNKTEKENPLATLVIRKGLPILDKNLKRVIEEIQNNANIACKESKGTKTEKIACAINKEVQKWKIGNQEYLGTQIICLVDLLKSYIPQTPENSTIIKKIDAILNEPDIVIQYMIVNNLIPQIVDINVSKKTDSILKEIQELKYHVDELVSSIDELQNPEEYLATIQKNLEEIKEYMPQMKSEIDKVLYILDPPMSTTQKLKIAIPLIPQIVTYEMETDVPQLVTNNILELKNLILKLKNK